MKIEVLPSQVTSAAVDVVSSASMLVVCAVVDVNPEHWRQELPRCTAELLGDGARWLSFERALRDEAGCPGWAVERARACRPWRLFGEGYEASEVELEIQLHAWSPGKSASDILEPAAGALLERSVTGIVDLLILCRREEVLAGRAVHAVLSALADCVRPSPLLVEMIGQSPEVWVAHHVHGAGRDDREGVRAWRASRDWSTGV